MHLRILQSCPAVGAWLAGQLHRFVTALSDVAEILEMNRPNPVNWRELADRMEEVANKVSGEFNGFIEKSAGTFFFL